MDDVRPCRCGNEQISVIMTVSGTQIYCARCGRSTKRRTRREAIEAWNARTRKGVYKDGKAVRTDR